MRNIFFLILIFITGNIYGQSWNPITGKTSFTDSVRYLKYKGVNNLDSVLMIHPTTGVLIKGVKGLTPSVGVDSITLYYNQLCQWSGGIPTCYFLQPSTFGANDSLHLNFDSTWILHYSNGTLLSDSIYLIHTVLYTDNHFALSPYLAPYTQLLEATRLVDSVYASPFGTSFNYIKYATGHIDSLAAGGGGSSSGLDSTYISADSLYQIFIYASGRIDTVEWIGNGGSGGGSDVTASNGLTKVVDDIRLGGTLLGNTQIDATSAYLLTITGSNTSGNSMLVKNTASSSSSNALQVDGTGATEGIGATSGSGIAIRATSTTGIGILSNATTSNGSIVGVNFGTGYGGSFTTVGSTALLIQANPSSTSTVIPVLDIRRLTTGTAANGIGSSIDMLVEAVDGSNYITNQLISKLTNATSVTSEFSITGINSGSLSRKLALAGSGQLTLDGYASSGFYSGDTSANKPLIVDASGVVKQGYWAGSSVVTTIYSGDGSFSSNRTVGLNGKTFRMSDAPSVTDYFSLDPVAYTGRFVIDDASGSWSGLTLDANSSGTPKFILEVSSSKLTNVTGNGVTGLLSFGADSYSFYNYLLTSNVLTLNVTGVINISNAAGYQDFISNAAAISGGLVAGDVYRTGDFLKVVH